MQSVHEPLGTEGVDVQPRYANLVGRMNALLDRAFPDVVLVCVESVLKQLREQAPSPDWTPLEHSIDMLKVRRWNRQECSRLLAELRRSEVSERHSSRGVPCRCLASFLAYA